MKFYEPAKFRPQSWLSDPAFHTNEF